MPPPVCTAVVIATRNRPLELAATVGRLRDLPERPSVVVVDNASDAGSVAPAFDDPEVEVVRLSRNLGGAARTVGARRIASPYVAFSDDDSWWAPGALGKAADILDAHPSLGLVAARVLVGPRESEDPVCEAMRSSPLPPRSYLPGPPVLGFVACGAVVRRSAFLEVGGFHPHFGIGGEEELLALDLAATGWELAYVDHIVAHHHPSPSRDPAARRRGQIRNALWSAWLRRPVGAAARATVRLVAGHPRRREAAGALRDALRGVRWVARERQAVPPAVERAVRMLE
ncbi:MAG: glycosyltransferase family 2 protein [Thermoleophilaceae bacterium]